MTKEDFPGDIRLKGLAGELDRELREDILPFWALTMDLRQGGFAGRVTNDLYLDWQSPKGVVMHSRHLWTYSQAWLYRHNPIDLASARHAYAFLTGSLYDKEEKGFWWTVDSEGSPGSETKVIYGQAFAIYGLSRYFQATGDQRSLETALETFGLVESAGRDRERGGYYEAVDRRWTHPIDQALGDGDISCSKSMNTNLHVLEAYSALFSATGSPVVKEALAALLDVFEKKILVTPEHLGLYFDRDWTCLTDHISFGHDVEAGWLMTEAAHLLFGPTLPPARKEVYVTMAQKSLAVVRENRGSMPNELHNGTLDSARIWWVQAETLVGLVNGWELTGDGGFLDVATEVWDFVRAHMVDKEHGEWFWQVDAHGKPALDKPKGGLWKTCYHNGRACMEINRRAL